MARDVAGRVSLEAAIRDKYCNSYDEGDVEVAGATSLDGKLIKESALYMYMRPGSYVYRDVESVSSLAEKLNHIPRVSDQTSDTS